MGKTSFKVAPIFVEEKDEQRSSVLPNNHRQECQNKFLQATVDIEGQTIKASNENIDLLKAVHNKRELSRKVIVPTACRSCAKNVT